MTLPPEWWPQSAVMLTWPHAHGDWGDNLPAVEHCFVQIATAISQHQRLIISAYDAACRQNILGKLRAASANLENVDVYIVASNDIWVRDHGPLTTIDNGRPTLLDFQFNGWGGKYTANLDNQLSASLQAQNCFGPVPLHSITKVIEGGGIEVNGQGCLLTTANCLTLETRNPGLSEPQLEEHFAQWFGCDKTHWLRSGHMVGDDTDGHIDTLARFCSSDTIVYQSCADPDDEHFPALQAMAAELAEFRDQNDKPYNLQSLPLPSALYNAQGERLPAGYANFLIINGAVLMPGYNDAADIEAAAILSTCFPDREVISIDCRALVEQFGSLHCATMQLPFEVGASMTGL